MKTFPAPNRDVLLNKHSTTSRAYRISLEGKIAFLSGKAVDDCPYDAATPEEDLWMVGWREEFFDAFDAVGGLLI